MSDRPDPDPDDAEPAPAPDAPVPSDPGTERSIPEAPRPFVARQAGALSAFGVGLVGILVGAAIGWMVRGPSGPARSSSPDPGPDERCGDPVRAQEPGPQKASKNAVMLGENTWWEGDQLVCAGICDAHPKFEGKPESPEATLSIERTDLSSVGDRGFWLWLYGRGTITADFRAERIALSVTLMDGAGAELQKLDVDVLPSFGPPHLQGDTYVIQANISPPARTATVRLDAMKVMGVPNPPAPVGEATKVAWDVPQPAGTELTFQVRRRQVTDDGVTGVVAITNQGTTTLSIVDLVAHDGPALRDVAVAQRHLPRFLPGERRLLAYGIETKEDFGRDTFSVKAIE